MIPFIKLEYERSRYGHRVLCRFGLENFKWLPVRANNRYDALLEAVGTIRKELDDLEMSIVEQRINDPKKPRWRKSDASFLG